MRSCFSFVTLAATLVATVAAAPSSARNVVDLAKKSYVDYGPPLPQNCSVTPDECPTGGPSGTLNSPSDGAVLTTYFDNSGFVDVSYTPVQQSVGDSGSVKTTSVIFTLRQFFYGVPAFDDKIIVIGQLAPPADFSDINVRLSLPARFYDGDSDEMNDVGLGGGEWGFQVVEQQAYVADSASQPKLIEFYSANPLVNITYVGPPSQ